MLLYNPNNHSLSWLLTLETSEGRRNQKENRFRKNHGQVTIICYTDKKTFYFTFQCLVFVRNACLHNYSSVKINQYWLFCSHVFIFVWNYCINLLFFCINFSIFENIHCEHKIKQKKQVLLLLVSKSIKCRTFTTLIVLIKHKTCHSSNDTVHHWWIELFYFVFYFECRKIHKFRLLNISSQLRCFLLTSTNLLWSLHRSYPNVKIQIWFLQKSQYLWFKVILGSYFFKDISYSLNWK